MKTIYFLSICAITILFSCSDNKMVTNHPIQKRWELERVTRGLDNSISYSEGLVFWTFSETKLKVENYIMTLGPEQLNSGYETGTYSYEIKKENGVEVLFVNNKREGKIAIENNRLTIDYGVVSDALTRYFKH